jgi:polyisoprenoid-binding protein YceI
VKAVAMLRALALSLLFACPAIAQDALPPPGPGNYTIDLGHSRLLFRVSHLGFSNYTALFTKYDATLKFDPANPTAMSVSATIDIPSLETHYPDPAFDFNAVLTGAELLDAAAFPTATFSSTAVTLTGPETADVTGMLTLHGVTKPVTLAVTFNGGWGAMPMDPSGARIGFSATTHFNRSDFGMGFGVPEPGSEMGVSDRVDIIIETEFTSVSAATPLP